MSCVFKSPTAEESGPKQWGDAQEKQNTLYTLYMNQVIAPRTVYSPKIILYPEVTVSWTDYVG